MKQICAAYVISDGFMIDRSSQLLWIDSETTHGGGGGRRGRGGGGGGLRLYLYIFVYPPLQSGKNLNR